MGWFDWFRRESPPIIDHPVFGRLRAAHRPKDRPWLWEPLEFLETPRGKVFVHLDAGEAGPAPVHERQWERILAEADDLTRAAAPFIADELKDWDVPFDAIAPWDEITWEGVDLLGATDPEDDFALVYACKSWPDAMITVYFKDGRPRLSRLDD
jgi:hypothetical protein